MKTILLLSAASLTLILSAQADPHIHQGKVIITQAEMDQWPEVIPQEIAMESMFLSGASLLSKSFYPHSDAILGEDEAAFRKAVKELRSSMERNYQNSGQENFSYIPGALSSAIHYGTLKKDTKVAEYIDKVIKALVRTAKNPDHPAADDARAALSHFHPEFHLEGSNGLFHQSKQYFWFTLQKGLAGEHADALEFQRMEEERLKKLITPKD